MFTKQLPSFGTGLKNTGKLLTILVITIFTLTALFSTSANAQPLSEDEVKSEIQKNSALFTPELIEKADPYVIYDEKGNALLLPNIEGETKITKEEKNLVKKAIQNYNLLPKKDKTQNIKEKKSDKEKFGHVSGSRFWFNWWGVSWQVDGTHLDNAINNYSFLVTLAAAPVAGACAMTGPAAFACGIAVTAAVGYLTWSINWCKINRGYVIFDINPFTRSVRHRC